MQNNDDIKDREKRKNERRRIPNFLKTGAPFRVPPLLTILKKYFLYLYLKTITQFKNNVKGKK